MTQIQFGVHFHNAKKIYIECLHDQVIFPSVKQEMWSTIGVDRVLSIESDHSPFLSNPAGRVKLFRQIGSEVEGERLDEASDAE